MDYMTLKEAAEKWGVTPRRVNYYCAGGRIPGAVKMAGVWLINPSLYPALQSEMFHLRKNFPLKKVYLTHLVHS